VLHDGTACATWSIARRARRATLEITPFAALPAAARPELEADALALLAAFEPDATGTAVAFR